MFGSYPLGTLLTLGNIEISTSKTAEFYTYCRTPGSIKKVISSDSHLLVHPVEPVTQPKEITHYFLVELKSPLCISPESTVTGYVTFPVEISVYVSNENIEQIDAFTLTNPKYTLYGPPEKGFVCKWWQSDIYNTIPEVDPLTEGVMKVIIESDSDDWVILKKIVFDAYYMKIYFKEVACMNAVVKVEPDTATTSFVKSPLKEDMTQAVELFTLRKIPLVEKHELRMEWGL